MAGNTGEQIGKRTVTPPHTVHVRLDNGGTHDARRVVDVVHVGKRFGENLPPGI